MSGNQESRVRKEENDDDEEIKKVNIWDCGSPLYDAHELVALSHIVERHFMVLPYLSGSRTEAVSCSSSSSEKAVETTSSESGGSRSSVLGFFRMNVWKRKMDGEGKQKAKKQKTGISKIFAWKK